MKLSTKLALTIATAIGGLILVTGVGLHQIDHIRETTVTFVDHFLPAAKTRDEIRHDVMELKSIALEMIVDKDNAATLAVLADEFSRTRERLLTLLKHYNEQLAVDAVDRKLFDELNLLALRVSEHLYRVTLSVYARDIDSANMAWHSSDPLIDQLFAAQNTAFEHLDAMTRADRNEADKAHLTALMAALMTSGLVITFMAGMAFWAYRGVVGSIDTLQEKLDEISASLDLGQRVSLGSSDEMRRATEAINRLLERTRGAYTDIVALHDEASHLAQHDTMTGLPNRVQANAALDEALTHAQHTGQKLALLFIDLDGFKAINDSFGHNAGDHLLIEVAHRLRSSLRNEDLAARLGGDEFLIMLPGLSAVSAAGNVARKIIEAVGKEVHYHEQALRVGASVGIAVFPDHASDAGALLQAADEAMYRAKQGGKNDFRFYETPSSQY